MSDRFDELRWKWRMLLLDVAVETLDLVRRLARMHGVILTDPDAVGRRVDEIREEVRR